MGEPKSSMSSSRRVPQRSQPEMEDWLNFSCPSGIFRRSKLFRGTCPGPESRCAVRSSYPRSETVNIKISGGVTKHAEQFLDSVALRASSRPPTRDREFRGRFLNTRTRQTKRFQKLAIWGSQQTSFVNLKLNVSKTFLISAL